MNTNAGVGAGTTTSVDVPPVLIPLALAPVPGLVRVLVRDHRPLRDTRAHAHALVPIHSTGFDLVPAPAPVRGKEKGTMNTLVPVLARPADVTFMHVSVPVSVSVSVSAPVSVPVPVFLPVPVVVLVVVVITSSLVICPVLEEDVVVLRLSDTHLVNLILRVNGQDENVNTMCIASGRRRLAVLLVAVAAAAAVLCLDNLSFKSGRVCPVDFCASFIGPSFSLELRLA